MGRWRSRQVVPALARAAVYTLAALLLLVTALLVALETAWAKNQLRALIVRQGNQYLTATLEIGALEGSLVRGLSLRDVRLARDGRDIVAIEQVSLAYSIRELIDRGTTIRRLRLVNPVIAADRQEDGRWNLAALVRSEARQQERRGPGRPIRILALEVVNGSVSVGSPLTMGIARVPRRYDALNLALSFEYRPVQWQLVLHEASWDGGATDLSMRRLTGTIANGPKGWTFEKLDVQTTDSAFSFAGRVNREQAPTTLDIAVDARRFSFQEWAVVVPQLRNIAIDAAFTTRLIGPLTRLATDIALQSNGGSVTGKVTLNTRVPEWRVAGALDVNRLNLAPWFSQAERPSDISGLVTFDLEFGRRFPRGAYRFDGPHVEYFGYEADNVRARGTITDTETLIDEVTATAYGADMRVADGAIGINKPYPFRFRGLARGVDLRLIPAAVPVPRVESTLAFEYDVRGRFSMPYITADATFEPSSFLGASIGAGTVGTIDTAARPIIYAGEGDITGIDLNRFGADLDILWLQHPRYGGTVSGRFHVRGAGAGAAMTLTGGGRLARADLFGGRLSDAEVSIEIADGSLVGAYDGQLSTIDPSIALQDPQFAASLTGAGRARVAVRDFLIRATTLADYDVESALILENSTIRDIRLSSASAATTLKDSALQFSTLELSGPGFEGRGDGTISFDDERGSDFRYDITRLDLAELGELAVLRDVLGTAAGQIQTKGRLTGRPQQLRLGGDATVTRLDAGGIRALTTTGEYDVSFPLSDPARLNANVKGRISFAELFDQTLQQVEGTVEYADGSLRVDVDVAVRQGVTGELIGTLLVDRQHQRIRLLTFTAAIQNTRWTLVPSTPAPTISWQASGISVTPLTFTDAASASQRIALAGDWREDGRGAFRVTATNVFIDTLTGGGEQPARYGGVLSADAVISGTRDRPRVTSSVAVTQGRIRRLSYDRLAGRVDFVDGEFDVDLRLDQGPGVWLTATGTVPLGVFNPALPERPMQLAVRSSAVSLALVEGVTDVVRDVGGEIQIDLTAVGTTRDPHFKGAVNITGAAFTTVASGARYQNGRAILQLSPDRISVDTLHLEDRDGHPLDVKGTLGTHELSVGDLEIEVSARQFEVLRNTFGTVAVDARLNVRGRAESPTIEGRIAVASGELDVDAILDRTLFQPYSTQATPETVAPLDAIAALNPWERLGLNIELHVPGTLRMTGDDVQVTAGTPIGLGNINLRVVGDLFLRKASGGPLQVTGAFDRISGTYAFQGRRFDIEPESTITFRGDLNPELNISVTREISGVETRVAIAGPLREPELRLSSTPPLDATDILSLIVFNAPANELTGQQQRELAVRAGTLAAGFLATPLVQALERTLGLDILEIEASTEPGNVARVTVGDEIAPGLVARFSRQFGETEYDEATIEYSLSRILRIRATFSDASAALRRYPFRRVERAGIDLLFFFSF